MTPYRIVDRLGEPTSWIGVLVALIGYAIPLLIPPTAWSHVAGCVQTLLGTALFFLPDNRMIASAEDIAKAIAGMLPPSYAAPAQPAPVAVSLGRPTIATARALGPLVVLAVMATALSGCQGINAWIAGVESAGAADAAGAANNIHTADVLAVQGWKREACALTLGGLSGAGDPVATKAAIQSCPPSNVLVVSGTDGMSVQLPAATVPAPNPLAVPPAAAPRTAVPTS